MRVAVVDDDLQTRQHLAAIIKDYARAHSLAIETELFADGSDLLDAYQGQFDIIYLDIQMKWLDGMKTAEQLRTTDTDVAIVFVTNFVQYAINGYSVNAADFLLKPVTAFAFEQHFNKVHAKLVSHDESVLTFKSAGSLIRLPIDDITFIESRGHYLTIHTPSRHYIILGSMKQTEQRLKDYKFFRCNNSFLVHLPFVSAVEESEVIVDGKRLQISRPRKKDFLQALTTMLGDEVL